MPFSPPILQTINIAGRPVDVLRLDLIGGAASGNKIFKLKANLVEARHRGATTLASFGGAWSNHLHALAATARAEGFNSVGWVRADENSPLTPTLADCQRWGMQLVRLSRSDYRRRHDAEFVAHLTAGLERPWLIPEGGGNLHGALGCGEIALLLPQAGGHYHQILLACATGTTLAGLAAAYRGDALLTGVAVLPGEKFLARDVAQILAQMGGVVAQWQLDFRFHGGAYARVLPELAEFLIDWEQRYPQLPLDPVYTGKLFFAVSRRIAAGEFSRHQRLLLIHTGGLQGRRGFPTIYSGTRQLAEAGQESGTTIHTD